MSQHVDTLKKVLANTYALLLKTQNYHWHVQGIHFPALHEMFETQYNELFEAVDEIAERIRTLGEQAPASFEDFQKLNELAKNNASANAKEMLEDLLKSHQKLIDMFKQLASESNDDLATEDFAVDRIADHQKTVWMLRSTIA